MQLKNELTAECVWLAGALYIDAGLNAAEE